MFGKPTRCTNRNAKYIQRIKNHSSLENPKYTSICVYCQHNTDCAFDIESFECNESDDPIDCDTKIETIIIGKEVDHYKSGRTITDANAIQTLIKGRSLTKRHDEVVLVRLPKKDDGDKHRLYTFDNIVLSTISKDVYTKIHTIQASNPFLQRRKVLTAALYSNDVRLELLANHIYMVLSKTDVLLQDNDSPFMLYVVGNNKPALFFRGSKLDYRQRMSKLIQEGHTNVQYVDVYDTNEQYVSQIINYPYPLGPIFYSRISIGDIEYTPKLSVILTDGSCCAIVLHEGKYYLIHNHTEDIKLGLQHEVSPQLSIHYKDIGPQTETWKIAELPEAAISSIPTEGTLYIVHTDLGKRLVLFEKDKGGVLGSGNFGKVEKYQDAFTEDWYALKTLINTDGPLEIDNEVSVSQEIRKNNRCKAASYVSYRAENDGNIYMLSMQIGISLIDILSPKLDDVTLFIIMLKLAYSIKCFHDTNLRHCDIKLENVILVCQPGVDIRNLTDTLYINTNIKDIDVLLIDFGLVLKNVPGNERFSSRGTQITMAPERCLNNKSDVWSFGIIIVYMLIYKYLDTYILFSNNHDMVLYLEEDNYYARDARLLSNGQLSKDGLHTKYMYNLNIMRNAINTMIEDVKKRPYNDTGDSMPQIAQGFGDLLRGIFNIDFDARIDLNVVISKLGNLINTNYPDKYREVFPQLESSQ